MYFQMKKKNRLKGAIIGLIASLILLTITIIIYYNTVTFTFIETSLSGIFRIFTILYSWPYLIFAYLMDLIGINIMNIPLLIIISSGTYTLIGAFLDVTTKKRSKSSRH